MPKRKVEIEIKARDKASKTLKALATGAIAGIGISAALSAKQLGATLGRQLVRISKLIIEVGSGFEKSMSGVKAITKGTAAEMASLEKVARSLGKSTVFSAGEAGKAMEQFAIAGFSVNEILKATPAALDLAAAGELSMAEAAEIAANALRQFKLDTSETERVVDVLAGTASTSLQTVRDMGEAMKFAGLTAQQLGLSVEETAALVGKLADVGLKGSIGGTALRRSFAVFLGQLEPGEQGLKNFNVALAMNEDGTFNFAKALDLLNERGMTAEDVLTAFGLRAGPAMNELLSLGGDAIRDYTGEIEAMGGVAKQIGEDRLDNLRGDVTRLTSALSETAVVIFKEVGPALRLIVQEATAVITKFNDMSDGNKDFQDSMRHTVDILLESGELLVALTGFMATFLRSQIGVLQFIPGLGDVAVESLEGIEEATDSLGDSFDRLAGSIAKSREQADLAAQRKSFEDAFDALNPKEGAVGFNAPKPAPGRPSRGVAGGGDESPGFAFNVPGEEFQGPEQFPGQLRGDLEAVEKQGPDVELFIAAEELKRQQIQQTLQAVLNAALAVAGSDRERFELQTQLEAERYTQQQEAFAGNNEALANLKQEHELRQQEIDQEFFDARMEIDDERIEAAIEAENLRFEEENERLAGQLDLQFELWKAHQARIDELKALAAAKEKKLGDLSVADQKKALKAQAKETGAALAEAFGKQKEFAIVMTIINTAQAIMEASKMVWPLNLVMMALMAAEGAAQIAIIKGANFAHGGRAVGGIPGVDSIPALLQEDEVVIPANIVRQFNRPGGIAPGGVSVREFGGAGGGTTIQVFQEFNVGGETVDEGDEGLPNNLRDLLDGMNDLVIQQGGELVASSILRGGSPIVAEDL